MSNWQPKTFEDYLLKRYLDENPGKLFLEVPVSVLSKSDTARRIDGILIPGNTTGIYPQGSYNSQHLYKEFEGQVIHLLEAKSSLDRYLVGQVLVGESLLKRVSNPSEIINVAVCGGGNSDIEWYCKENNIQVAIYDDIDYKTKPPSKPPEQRYRKDIRLTPDANRYRAFLAGWKEAVNGKLYKSIHAKKTHANMGNLFGWIYGDQSEDFMKDTWDRYIEYSNYDKDENRHLNNSGE